MIEIWNNGLFIKNLGGLDMQTLLLCSLLCAVSAYFIGSINFRVVISKIYSGNIDESADTIDMFKVYGKKAGICTLLADVLKAMIVQIIGRLILGMLGAYIVGFFCIIGHAYPAFFKFKGGKGTICIATMVLMTTPIVFLIMLVIFLIILFGFKMISLASVMCSIVYPLVLANVTDWRDIRIIIAVLCSAIVIFLYRKNIVRIFNHEEDKISIGKKKGGNNEKRQK